jgi:two-component system, NarL family, sensor kinase
VDTGTVPVATTVPITVTDPDHRSGGPEPEDWSPSWRVVVGRGDRPAHEPPGVRGVLLRVVASALVVLVVVALVGSLAARRLAERQSVNDAAVRADLVAEDVVQPVLQDGILSQDPARRRAAAAALDVVVRERVLSPTLVRVKVWSADGQILYSDEARLIGRTFERGQEERQVLTDPETRAEVSDLQKPENVYERGQGRLLEVYRPIWTPSGQPVLFETYAPYDEVTRRGTEMWRGFAGLMASSLLVLVVLLLPVIWRLLDGMREVRSQREELLQRSVDASLDERRRIAGNLHDGVVQDLVATSFAVAGSAEKAGREGSEPLAAELRGAAATVRTSIGGLRSLLVDIYPPTLETAGLAAALADLVAPLRSRQIHVDLLLPDDLDPLGLDADQQRLVYRVVQECLRNVSKHARATGVEVQLTPEDDGVGFDAALILARPAHGHLGLRVMGDLARDGGAELSVWSGPGEGTTWRLVMVAAGA